MYGKIFQELPRVFLHEYGESLSEVVTLVMPDGMKFITKFSLHRKVLYMLKQLVEAYKLAQSYILFFDYVGSNTFYITIYDKNGMDIFNYLSNKLHLVNIMNQLEEEVMMFSHSRIDEGGTNNIRVLFYFRYDRSKSICRK